MPAAGIFGRTRIFLPIRAIIATGTSAEEYLTDLVTAFRFTLEKAWFVVDTVGTGAGATRPFRILKTEGTTDYTAATATITLAATATKGATVAFTLSNTPSDYEFFDASKLTIDVQGSGTQFTALAGTFILQLRTRPQA